MGPRISEIVILVDGGDWTLSEGYDFDDPLVQELFAISGGIAPTIKVPTTTKTRMACGRLELLSSVQLNDRIAVADRKTGIFDLCISIGTRFVELFENAEKEDQIHLNDPDIQTLLSEAEECTRLAVLLHEWTPQSAAIVSELAYRNSDHVAQVHDPTEPN